jgi:acetyl esterase
VLDPEAQELVDERTASPSVPIYERDLTEVRLAMAEAGLAVASEEVASVVDSVVPRDGSDIKVRIYRPELRELSPGLIYIHGGNWVAGNLDSHDVDCRSLTNRAQCTVISVDYPLAPEHKFPQGLEAAYAVAEWLIVQGHQIGVDTERIGVCGLSAGGNIAAAMCLMSRDRGGPSLACQVLVYPVTDSSLDTPSYHTFGEGGYLLTRESMRWSWQQYVGRPQDLSHPYASPMRAESLRGLPQALVLVAGCDPLRDEGEAYASRLAADGVPTKFVCYEGMVHTFFSMPYRLEAARRAHEEAARFLKSVFEGI